MSRRAIGSASIAACAASWGAMGVIVRELDMPPLTIAFFQQLQGLVVAALVALVWRPALLRPPRFGVTSLGVLLAIHFACLYAAFGETSVASAVLVTYSAPIMIALLAPALLRERVSRVTVVALGVSGAGVAGISLAGGDGGGSVHAAGIALALGAAVTYAFIIVLLKRWTADVNPLTVVVWQGLAAALVLSPAAFVADYTLGARELGYLALLGIAITGVTGIVYVLALRLIPATTAGILGYLEPLSAVVLAAVFLGEEPTVWVVVGGAAIVAAGVAVMLEDPAGDAEPVAPVAATATPARRS